MKILLTKFTFVLVNSYNLGVKYFIGYTYIFKYSEAQLKKKKKKKNQINHEQYQIVKYSNTSNIQKLTFLVSFLQFGESNIGMYIFSLSYVRVY